MDEGQPSTSTTFVDGAITLSQQVAASSTGAVLSALFVTPLDVVKVRLQAQQHPLQRGSCFICGGLGVDTLHYCTINGNQNCPTPWYARPSHFRGTGDAFLKIVRNEGVTQLWSGLGATLVMALPATVLYFSLYDTLLTIARRRMSTAQSTTNAYFVLAPMLAGVTARTATVTAVSPIELLRTKLQSERMSYKELVSQVRASADTVGWRVLWRGWIPTMMRDVPFSAMYWAGYEYVKMSLAGEHEKPKTWMSFVAGAISGAVASLCTHPFDVIKTQRQVAFFACGRQLK